MATRFSTETPDGRAAEFFDQASTTIDLMQSMNNQASVDLQEAIRGQLAAIDRQIVLLGALFGGAVLLLGYLLVSFHVTFQASLRALRRGTDAMAQGDLAHHTEVRGRDVRFHDETIDEAYASRAVYGAPDWEVDADRATIASTSTVRGWEALPVRLP